MVCYRVTVAIVDVRLDWVDVLCVSCGRICGRVKNDEAFSRWHATVMLAIGRWAAGMHAKKRVRQKSAVGEADDWAVQFVRDNRECCG